MLKQDDRRDEMGYYRNYKTITGKYTAAAAPILTKLCKHAVRGNDMRLQKTCSKYKVS